jgi:hypothetical protein
VVLAVMGLLLTLQGVGVRKGGLLVVGHVTYAIEIENRAAA